LPGAEEKSERTEGVYISE